MKCKYNVEVEQCLSMESQFYGIIRVMLRFICVIALLYCFIGNVGKVADEVYMANGMGVSEVILFSLPVGAVIYSGKLGIEIMMSGVPIKFRFYEIICFAFGYIGAFNYLIYLEKTNDKKLLYLVIIYFVLLGISIIFDKVIRYNLWKKIYKEGIELYGDKFGEYHEVKVNCYEKLTDREQLDILINVFNFGEIDRLIIGLVKLQIKYKENKPIKS
ncbi:MAG: hypothetical protein ACLS9F_19050 [Clostridium paraputrificum]